MFFCPLSNWDILKTSNNTWLDQTVLSAVQICFWGTFTKSSHRQTKHFTRMIFESVVVSNVLLTQSVGSKDARATVSSGSKFKQNFAAVSKFGAEHKIPGRGSSLNWAGASVCLIIISLLLPPHLPPAPAPMIPRPLITWGAQDHPPQRPDMGDKCLEKTWKITREKPLEMHQSGGLRGGDADTNVYTGRKSNEHLVMFIMGQERRGETGVIRQGRNVISVCWTNSTVEHHKLIPDRFTGAGVNIWRREPQEENRNRTQRSQT